MDILAVENDIVSHLQADISGMNVKSFAENPNEFRQKTPRRQILVTQGGGTFDDPDPKAMRKSQVRQNSDIQWSIIIMWRGLGLKGHVNSDATDSVYTYIEAVRKSLTGYTPASIAKSSVMWPVQYGFIEESNGVFIYEYQFQHTLPETEVWQ